MSNEKCRRALRKYRVRDKVHADRARPPAHLFPRSALSIRAARRGFSASPYLHALYAAHVPQWFRVEIAFLTSEDLGYTFSRAETRPARARGSGEVQRNLPTDLARGRSLPESPSTVIPTKRAPLTPLAPHIAFRNVRVRDGDLSSTCRPIGRSPSPGAAGCQRR